jgi:hypothetical protein
MAYRLVEWESEEYLSKIASIKEAKDFGSEGKLFRKRKYFLVQKSCPFSKRNRLFLRES